MSPSLCTYLHPVCNSTCGSKPFVSSRSSIVHHIYQKDEAVIYVELSYRKEELSLLPLDNAHKQWQRTKKAKNSHPFLYSQSNTHKAMLV